MLDKKIRKLARSQKWQNLYQASKNCGFVSLFNNSHNYSGLQIKFLYYLSVYDMLYAELAKHEDPFLSEQVIQNDRRCDCYLIYRNKKHDYLWKQYRKDERARDLKNRNPNRRKRTSKGKQTSINVDLRRE